MSSQVFACGLIVPDCDFRAEGATEEEVFQKVVEHARTVHGVAEMSPELVNQVKSAIVTT